MMKVGFAFAGLYAMYLVTTTSGAVHLQASQEACGMAIANATNAAEMQKNIATGCAAVRADAEVAKHVLAAISN